MSFIISGKAALGMGFLILCASGGMAAAQGTAPAGNDLQKDQTTMNGQVMQNSGPSGLGGVSIRQGIQSSLQQAGYTDVSITPSSFYVRAKDKQGHPVAMVIGPDTVTEVTEVQVNGTSSSNAGSGADGSAVTTKGNTGSAP